ncbi:hypothetical protein SAMD00079811_00930 [Scytonema sp. HK-05]|uniref:hypothetical protein n=1 Tax=Scytonema sp. HK-05 TaxID=1137095 RepID=UPI000937EBED|nr:hypothetical protein [Scytonema sp. HK-05]OKH57391.1 hypothetical protein NIES2130_19895 [Scytonema sp. HK-05]BAY42516.1 hypothetical protein SAMD00079811_00930 [Scytonema sp. HK-05]
MAGSTSQLTLHSSKKPQEIVEEETHSPIAKPHSAVYYSITHALPTRVGFCIPRISEDREYVQRLQNLLACEPWIITQQINYMAGSIVITYKSGIMSDSEIRLYLANLIQSASNPEETMPATEKPVISSSVSQRATRKSVVQEKENGYETVSAGVSSDPRSVGMGVSLQSKSQTAGVSPGLELKGAGKMPTPQNQSNHDPKKIHQPTQPATVAYSIAHAIPGRVRFRVPRIAKDSKYVQRLEALLKADPVITGEHPFGASALRYRVNNAAASIVITYKSGAMLNSQKGSLSLLEQAISYLSSLIQSAAGDSVVAIN